jgi:dihydrofolate reductase
MRRIVAFDRVSADGYFAGDDGNLNWVVPDDKVEQEGMSALPNVDTMVFGRRTYELFESYWPNVLDDSDSAPDPHVKGRRSPEIRKMAEWINDTAKIVFSRSRKEVTWKNSTLVREVDPRAIEKMKNGPGGDMIIFGSGTIVSQLTQHGLVDEYYFIVGPVFLGSGKPLISGVPNVTRLKLLAAKEYQSGNLVLRYAPNA